MSDYLESRGLQGSNFNLPPHPYSKALDFVGNVSVLRSALLDYLGAQKPTLSTPPQRDNPSPQPCAPTTSVFTDLLLKRDQPSHSKSRNHARRGHPKQSHVAHITSMQLSVVGPDTSPQVRDLTHEVERIGNHAYAFGGFGDLWKGTWRGPHGEKAVAIKVLRISNDPNVQEKIGKRVRKELRIWQRLNHPNVIPLCGVSSAFGFYDSFVCPWMELGSLSTFLNNSKATLNLSRRLEILRDAADGLNYLHQEHVIHGDLTSPNVLLDSNGRAVLCDFGLSGVVAEVMSTTFMTSTISGNARWMAPELMALSLTDTGESEVVKTTYQSDMYSFGCLTLETLSGNRPYHYYTTEQQVLLSVSQGIKPRRPSNNEVSDKLWGFIQQLWAPAGKRISAELALEHIRGFLADKGM